MTNGNTLINYGTLGIFFEVTSSGEVVWKYINPVDQSGPVTQGDTIPNDPTHPGEQMNSVFRIYRYPVTYAAFYGRAIIPGDYIEKYSSTSVSERTSWVPNTFRLFQNYPNPFNPTTTIKFIIAVTSYVRLAVYDLLGKEVSVLINNQMVPGNYSRDFNGTQLSSGVYFYRLQAGEFINTKSMILMK